MVSTPKRKQKTSQKVIHQILFDIGRGDAKKIMEDKPEWRENMNTNKKLNPSWRHILWTDKSANAFVQRYYPQYKGMIASFPHRFYFIDFFRYLVLTRMGGIYIDMDVRCKKPLPNVDIILGGVYDIKDKINNNVIRLTADLNQRLLNYCVEEYKRIKSKDLFSTMPGRRFLHSVSATMFARFCRINKVRSDIPFRPFFYDEAARSWIKGEDAIVKKGY